MKRAVIFLLVLLCAAAATQETSRPPAPRPRTGNAAAAKAPAASQADIDALAVDVARMRSILQQMELNMGFLPAGQSPTKHQFELEVDMWRALLDHMDRRLQALRAESSSK